MCFVEFVSLKHVRLVGFWPSRELDFMFLPFSSVRRASFGICLGVPRGVASVGGAVGIMQHEKLSSATHWTSSTICVCSCISFLGMGKGKGQGEGEGRGVGASRATGYFNV